MKVVVVRVGSVKEVDAEDGLVQLQGGANRSCSEQVHAPETLHVHPTRHVGLQARYQCHHGER